MKAILIIDDEQLIRENVSELLESEGYNTFMAKDGASGIQKALQHRPNLIICDIDMPGINGYEVFSTLHRIPELADTPFIFLTAKSSTDDFRTGMQMGADDYLVKPFAIADLFNSVKIRFEKLQKYTRKPEKRFDALFDSPISGIILLNNNKIEIANQAALDLFGGSFKELKEAGFRKIISGNHKQDFLQQLELCRLGAQQSVNMTVDFVDQHKRTKTVSCFAKAFDCSGKSLVLVNIQQVNGSTLPIAEEQLQELFDFISQNPNIDLLQEFSLFLAKRNKKGGDSSIKITKREKDVLERLVEGCTTTEIAQQLFISPRTVEGHRNNLMQKTGATNTAALIAFTFHHHLLE